MGSGLTADELGRIDLMAEEEALAWWLRREPGSDGPGSDVPASAAVVARELMADLAAAGIEPVAGPWWPLLIRAALLA